MSQTTYLFAESTFHCPSLTISDNAKKNEILKIVDQYKLSIETLEKIKAKFLEEMDLGLTTDGMEKSCLQMENTFLHSLPTGDEEGNFLSLDLGSTNFRVILSKLRGNGNAAESDTIVKYYDIPDNYKINHESAKPLFDHIAECIKEFLSAMPELHNQTIPLGFTFSFPMIHKAIDVGLLITWTKCYDVPEVVNRNAVEFLQEAIKRKNLNVETVAIVNDTVGTLIEGASRDKECNIGVILGSGFNICYVEKAEKVVKWADRHKYEEVLIDIECGAFGDNGCIDFAKTELDRELDNDSLFKGSFAYEKMLAGKFLGDCVRRVILKLTKNELMFSGRVTVKLSQADSICSKDVSIIDSDDNANSYATKALIERLGYNDYTIDDVKIVEYVCSVLSIRAALLPSVLIATLIERINKKVVAVAIDGSLYNHPKFPRLLQDFTSKLAPGKKFKLMAAHDGSGKGAGIVAAIANKMKHPN